MAASPSRVSVPLERRYHDGRFIQALNLPALPPSLITEQNHFDFRLFFFDYQDRDELS